MLHLSDTNTQEQESSQPARLQSGPGRGECLVGARKGRGVFTDQLHPPHPPIFTGGRGHQGQRRPVPRVSEGSGQQGNGPTCGRCQGAGQDEQSQELPELLTGLITADKAEPEGLSPEETSEPLRPQA